MAVLSPLEGALREASQITGVVWAACVERGLSGWRVKASHRLGRIRQSVLLNYFRQPPVNSWMSGALIGKRSRSRKIPPRIVLGCEQLFVFPTQSGLALIVVGAASLSSDAQRVWRIVASSSQPSEALLGGWPAVPVDTLVSDTQGGGAYAAPQALEYILLAVVHAVPAQAAWLAIYRGDFLEVQAQWNCQCLGIKFTIGSSEIFQRITRTLKGMVVKKDQPEWALIPHKGLKENTRIWAGLPLVVGHRAIGMIVLWREKAFRAEEWQGLLQLASQVAPSVEVVVTFAELAGHLQRLAMLNDFALIVSSAQNLDQIARRVFALLARAFGTELISLFLLSSDGRSLRQYRNRGGKVAFQTLPVEDTPFALLLREGRLLRLEKIDPAEYTPVSENARAALFVPLKYRGQVIGALDVESEQAGAFGRYDEHLLVVIASHLAGLVEYGRLREEAEGRARSLGLIHEVVQQVIGLTDTAEVAQITADLLAQYFAYEVAAVLLADEKQELSVRGIGGSEVETVQRGLRMLAPIVAGGITGRVFATGGSMLVNDVAQEPMYRPIPDWDAGSEICVALRDGERILGLIDIECRQKNAFSHNDLLALESLAGILAGVVSSADQYQRLQTTVRQLRVMQRELQERIEAQRLAESRLVQAAKLAAVGEMASGIAHEINNPLTTVTGFAELVLEELPPDASQRADVELILRESRRARSVVRRLLDFARQGESVRVRADFNEIVTDVVALTNHLFHTSGVQVELQLAEGLAWPMLDRNQMKQVVLNLLHNALQAMPSGGSLTLRTAARSRDGRRWLTLSVQDTGVGIPSENVARIFEPFFTTKADNGGTGLGLSVTYGIVTDHGGFIDVTSEPGSGSCFTVWLPVEE